MRTHLRALAENDLEPIADLFLKRFRRSDRSTARAREEVAAYLKTLYLDYPTRRGEPEALVALDGNGDVAAFVGCVGLDYRFDGRPVRVGVSGTLMSAPGAQQSLAAIHLLRESRQLGFDLIFTDSANRSSLAMCQAMNYQVVSPESLEWVCVFEPCALALHKLRQRLGTPWLRVLNPLARGVDLAASRPFAQLGASSRGEWRDEEVDAESFVDAAPTFWSSFRLQPDLQREDFLWHVRMASERRSAGPLRLRLLYSPTGVVSAAYAFFGGRGDVARVFHVSAAPNAWGRLFDNMLITARESGCIGAHGPLRKSLLPPAYASRGVFFLYSCGMLAYSSRPEVAEAVAAGEAFLGGFAGDRWTRLASDKFG